MRHYVRTITVIRTGKPWYRAVCESCGWFSDRLYASKREALTHPCGALTSK